jgi:exosortase/archaeosortase family protein
VTRLASHRAGGALPERRRLGRAERLLRASGRLVAGLALVGIVALLLVNNAQLRTKEAQAVAVTTSLATGTKAIAVNQSFAWGLDPDTTAHALRVTNECTSAFLLVPLLVVGAVVAAAGGRRFRLRRVLAATAICAAVAFGINVLRLTMIAWATNEWGEKTGYEWSHVVAGSVVTIIGATTAVAIFFVILISGSKRGRAACSVI